MKLKIGRIVTVAYVALIKIDRKIQFSSPVAKANWYDMTDIKNMQLAFDHKEIIMEGIQHIRHRVNIEPRLFFELLPRKFTMSQLRILHDVIHQTNSDVRNFQKKVAQWPWVIALDEQKKNVPHRAARLYKVDRKKNLSI
jgi:hypothetical protein